MFSTWALGCERGTEEPLGAELGQVIQMVNDMIVHRHDDLFSSFLLLVTNNALLGMDVLPSHVNAIAQSRAHEIPEENERLPFNRRRGIKEFLHFGMREHIP